MEMFKKMSTAELIAWIRASHATRNFDMYFEAACIELNSRTK